MVTPVSQTRSGEQPIETQQLAVQQQQQTSLNVACSKDTDFQIKLSPKNGNANGLGDMVNGTNKIAYQLHHEGPAGPVWGNVEANHYKGKGTGTTVNIPVHATVEATQVNAAIPGVYTDTVDVLVTF